MKKYGIILSICTVLSASATFGGSLSGRNCPAKPDTVGAELDFRTLRDFMQIKKGTNNSLLPSFKDHAARLIECAIGGAYKAVTPADLNGLSTGEFAAWQTLGDSLEMKRAIRLYNYESWRVCWEPDISYKNNWRLEPKVIQDVLEIDIRYNRDMIQDKKNRGLRDLKTHSSKMSDLLTKVNAQSKAVNELLVKYSLLGDLDNQPSILATREAAYKKSQVSTSKTLRRRYINGQWRTLVNGAWT